VRLNRSCRGVMQKYEYDAMNRLLRRPGKRPDGLLFIGDPQVSTLPPAERVEEDFLSVSVGKLEKAVEVANEQNAVPVILGDLTEYPAEPSKYRNNAVISALMRTLAKSVHYPVCLVGNHDLHETRLTDEDVLGVIDVSMAALVIREVGATKVSLSTGCVLLGGTPYGESLPEKVSWEVLGQDLRNDEVRAKVWLAHADIAFPDFGKFPGSVEPWEIEGVDMVINGHLHVPSRPVTLGKTTWHNPGNIVRLSRDAKVMAMEPSVSLWKPRDGGLRRVTIPHLPAEEVFKDEETEKVRSLVDVDWNARELQFATLVREETETELDSAQTVRGEILRAAVERALEETEADEEVRREVRALYAQVMEL